MHHCDLLLRFASHNSLQRFTSAIYLAIYFNNVLWKLLRKIHVHKMHFSTNRAKPSTCKNNNRRRQLMPRHPLGCEQPRWETNNILYNSPLIQSSAYARAGLSNKHIQPYHCLSISPLSWVFAWCLNRSCTQRPNNHTIDCTSAL